MGILCWLFPKKPLKSLASLEIRHLLASDFNEGFVETIAALSPVSLSQRQFGEIMRDRLRNNIETIVCVADNFIVGTASYFIEKKFLHNGATVMHVEDVAVHKDYQGNGIGKKLMTFLEIEAKAQNCYKIILNCSEENVNFYEKCSYKRHSIEMRKDL